MEPGARALLHANQPSLRLPAALPPSSRSLLRASSSRLRRSLLSSGPAAARFPLPGFPARPPRRWRASPGLAGPAQPAWGAWDPGSPSTPAGPACGGADTQGREGAGAKSVAQGHPGWKKEPAKPSQPQSPTPPHPRPAQVPRPELNLHPTGFPGLVRATTPRSPELLQRSSPPPPKRLRIVTLAPQHPALRTTVKVRFHKAERALQRVVLSRPDLLTPRLG